jgi:general secretion pathway protein D
MGVDVRRFIAGAGCALVLLASGARLRAQDTSAVQRTPQGILVDFQDADLRAVVTALAEAGDLNLSYNNLPSSHVTLHIRQPIAKADVLPLLKSVAQSNGLKLTEEGTLIRLEPVESPAASAANTAAQAPGGRTPMELYVYRLKHVRAAKLAATLQSIFGGRTGIAAVPGLSGRTLSQQLTGNQIPPLVDTAVVPPPAGGGATVSALRGELAGAVQIVPDETTNSLVIHAEPADYAIVQQAIQALDLRPLQVMIEVLIAEVRHSTGLDLSVKSQSTREAPDAKSNGSAFLSSTSTADLIIQLSKSAKFDLNLALSALQSRGDVRILSRPVLLAQNNQEAKILVGSQRPFVQVSRSLPTDAAIRDQVVQYKDVGTSLTILPTINTDGYVDLQVSQEVSTATNEVEFGAPVISTREASTHLFVRDGQTAVLGGLIDREQESNRSGLPVLSTLPVIGALFGTTSNTTTSSELFLFLTPHIVATDEDADRVREGIENLSPGVKNQLPTNPPMAIPDTNHAPSVVPKRGGGGGAQL